MFLNMKYLTYNVNLNTKLESLGFKRKGRSYFYKKTDDSILEIAFSHSSKGEPHVKYYYITIMFSFPKVTTIANDIDFPIVYGFSRHLGHIIPANRFIEWRIPDDDTEEHVMKVTDEMYYLIKTYAMPYFDKYCRIDDVIRDFENDVFPFFLNPQTIPVLYYIKGQKDKALQYMDNHLKILREKDKDNPSFSIETKKTEDSEITSIFVRGQELSLYEEFVMKIKKLIGNNGMYKS